MCFAPQRRPLFSTSQLSKSGPNLVCFVHFDFECAPRHNGVHFFRHHNFQKVDRTSVFCAFRLGNAINNRKSCVGWDLRVVAVICSLFVVFCFSPRICLVFWSQSVILFAHYFTASHCEDQALERDRPQQREKKQVLRCRNAHPPLQMCVSTQAENAENNTKPDKHSRNKNEAGVQRTKQKRPPNAMMGTKRSLHCKIKNGKIEL